MSRRVAPILFLDRPVASASGGLGHGPAFRKEEDDEVVCGGESPGAGAGAAVRAFPGKQNGRVLGHVAAVAGDEGVESRSFQSGEAGVPQPGGELVTGGKTSELGTGRGRRWGEWFGTVKSARSAVSSFDRAVSSGRFPHPACHSHGTRRSTSPALLSMIVLMPWSARGKGWSRPGSGSAWCAPFRDRTASVPPQPATNQPPQ